MRAKKNEIAVVDQFESNMSEEVRTMCVLCVYYVCIPVLLPTHTLHVTDIYLYSHVPGSNLLGLWKIQSLRTRQDLD